jgi:hypothetical protein
MTSTDDAINDPTELHARLTVWADANNDCSIPVRIALRFGTYQASLRLERLGGFERTTNGAAWIIRKAAAMLTDDGRHVCMRCYADFVPDPDQEGFCFPICRHPASCVYCCRDTFAGEPRDEFCSDRCQRIRDCGQCGTEFIPGDPEDGFCSKKCEEYCRWHESDPVGRFAVRYLTQN